MKKSNKNITGNATPAPAKKAEKNATTVASINNTKRDNRKEVEARSRARRMRSLFKLGMKQELIEEMFAQEDNRMVLVLLNGSYTVQDGTRTVKRRKRDETHHIKEIVNEEVPNILRGYNAARKYVEDQKLHFMAGGTNALWVLTDKNNVDEVVKKLTVLGRTSVTKPEKHTVETEKARVSKENKAPKKPTNNTTEVRKNAKMKRKTINVYYAALRKLKKNTNISKASDKDIKNAICSRIRNHNKTLADKVTDWLKEQRKIAAEKTDAIDKHKRNHRQMTSLEMKTNKRARKAVKHLAAKERRIAAEKKRAEYNAKKRAERAKNAQKPVQTELKMAA